MLFWNLWPIWKCKTNVLWINFLFFFALQIINPIHCNPLLKRQNPNETKIKFRARQPPGGSPRVTKSSLSNLQFSSKHRQTPIHFPNSEKENEINFNSRYLASIEACFRSSFYRRMFKKWWKSYNSVFLID